MKKLLSLFIALTIILSMMSGFAINVSADESGYAWVLVDTYQFPIPEDFKPGDPWSYFASIEGNTAELQTTIPYGLGIYASRDESNPGNLHVKYTWSNPPSVIQANETVSIALEQEVFSNKTGNFGVAISPFLSLDVADLIGLGYGTVSGVEATAIYEDGTETRWFGIGYGQDDRSQTSCRANMTLKFKDKGSAGDKWALYIGAYAGPPGKVGVRYTYEWKETGKSSSTTTTVTATTQTAPAGGGAEAFESGSRIMWQPANGIGYRLFRSTSQSSLGISVTDFYITSTSYADVNVEPNTTYYYTVKPVLAEANPFQGIEEKLGNAIAVFVITTGNQTYKPGSYKHFIMLKLDSPNMSVDGINQEVDPDRGTAPVVIAGRTMVPIRAVVEAMGGTVEWDGSTQKITLKARGNTVEMWMGKTDIKINGVSKKMDVAPVSKNNRTFVPVRFAAENLNCKVDWINSTKEAVIVYEE